MGEPTVPPRGLKGVLLRLLFRLLHFQRANSPALDAVKVDVFERLLAQLREGGSDSVLSYTCPYPKAEFLQYLTEQKGLLLHGTKDPSIALFHPRAQTTFYGGKVTAVFAAADGLWPMFFAVVDRAHCPEIRNGCFPVTAGGGRVQRYYYFALPFDKLAAAPWHEGYVYVLPKDTFRVSDNPAEWISSEPVTPLGKMAVSPTDFPFLDTVRGYPAGESMLRFFGRMIFSRPSGSRLGPREGAQQ